MKIELSLTTVSPYHSAPVTGGAFVVTDEGRITKKSSGAKGLPLTRTYTEPHYLPSIGETTFFPVIRSMQILKSIRNITNTNTLMSLKERGLQISSMSTYAGMQVGAASGKPTGMTPSLDQIKEALENPIALFGGGSYGLSSIVSVSDGVLLHELLEQESLVQKPAHVDPTKIATAEPFQLTYAVPITRNDPVNDIKGSELQNLAVIDDYQEQIKQWKEVVTGSQKKRKENAEEKKSDLNNLVACEAVARGLTFVSVIDIPDAAGSAVKGAVLNAVLELIEQGVSIGGRVSRGMGRFSVEATVNGDPLLSADAYESDLDEYGNWLDSVTPNQLSEFYEK